MFECSVNIFYHLIIEQSFIFYFQLKQNKHIKIYSFSFLNMKNFDQVDIISI